MSDPTAVRLIELSDVVAGGLRRDVAALGDGFAGRAIVSQARALAAALDSGNAFAAEIALAMLRCYAAAPTPAVTP